ncbi:MAG: AAA family ATPase, partial [Acidobacteriota bacterium]
MHHIRKLEMVGFKSFCDRIPITFHAGVTAIVGPNGCGKSNIADAISWVVGEQSAKSLRTDRMEGVIFNGTQKRKPTSMAEVTLTLSLDGGYPVPGTLSLNPEEFTVGRRLYRSGESEYYLDGKRCRLKDVQALFEGTGLGPNSYALIEQGRIGQILSSRPADRRSLIEEAARITLFKSRRFSAEMKLERAQQNLLRVNDIIREVTRQLNSLRRQAAKARRYNRLREELRNVHRLKFALDARHLRVRLEDCLGRFEAAQAREQDILAALSTQGLERDARMQGARNEEVRVRQLGERLSGLRVDAAAAQSLRQRNEARKLDLETRLVELEKELEAIEARAGLARRERERLEAVRARLADEVASGLTELERERARGEAVQEAIQGTESGIEELRAFLLNRVGQLSELRSALIRCQENLQRIASHSSRLEGQRLEQARERAEIARQLDERRSEYDRARIRRRECVERRVELERRAAGLESRIEQATAEAAALQEEYSIAQHRYSSLEEIERHRSNYSEGVQKYLAARIPGEDPVQARTLADYVETDPQFEAAVEDYLNDPLQYILVDRLDDAVRSVDRLKRIGAGRCTFLAIGNGHTGDLPKDRMPVAGEGVVGYLDQILRMREDVREAFQRALPEFASTVVVSNLDAAFRVAEASPAAHFLTVAGEAYSPKGTLSAAGERKSMAGFLSIKREKRDLESRLGAVRVRLELARREVARLKEEQGAVAEGLRTAFSESKDLEIETALLEHHIGRLQAELQKIDQSESVAGLELSQLEVERQDFEARLRNTETSIGEIEDRGRTSGNDMKLLAARLESLKEESAALARALAGLTSAHAVKQERLSATEVDLQRLLGEMEDIERRADANRSEAHGFAATVAGLEEEIVRAGQQAAELEQTARETETSLKRAAADLEAQRESLAALEQKISALHGERE